MKISNTGLELIKSFEGCILTAYDDSTGVLTIGYGHTSNVTKGMVITQAQADALLIEDLSLAESCVNNYVTVTLTQNQFDALVSFAFNCGNGALKSSTLLKKLNSGDYTGASCEFLKWCKDGRGNTMEGLLRRRQAEKELFNSKTQNVIYNVISLQCLLNEYGYRDSNGNELAIDGLYGVRTQQAVPILKYGMVNAVVKWVQGAIGITADGIFGNDTLRKVKEIQTKNDIAVDGIIGSDTWACIIREVSR